MGRLIAGSFNDTTTQERTLTGVDSSQWHYAQKAPLLWITLWPPSAQRNVPHMNSHPPRPFRRSPLFMPILYHIWGQISNEQFVYKSFELINGIEKRAVDTTARSLCLNSLRLKMDRLIAGLLRKLRPKSYKLTGLDRSLFYWRTQKSLCSELPMAAIGSEECSAHEQLPAASIQKVAIVHAHIIPYLRPDLKLIICGQKTEQRFLPAQTDCVNSIKPMSFGRSPLLLCCIIPYSEHYGKWTVC